MQVASFGSVQEPPSAEDEERIRQEEMDTTDAQFWVIALPPGNPKTTKNRRTGKRKLI